MDESLIPLERIELQIRRFRGQNVMIDRDLAELYGVSTKRLNEQVKRNLTRFPEDFMFQLTEAEAESLRSQIATLDESKDESSMRFQVGISKPGRGRYSKYLPYAFTEHGVVMLSSVLNSERAVHVNIAVVRAFVHLRQLLATHKDLARKLEQLEKKYDENFRVVFEAIRQLMEPPPEPPKGRFGFR